MNFWHSLQRPILALAPMEGYTDTVFRRLAREGGADVVYTEFVSSDAIAHSAKRSFDKLKLDPREQPAVAQIFGRDLHNFLVAAKDIERRGFAGLDLNFGCPARKVVGTGAGVALLRDPQYARQLIEAVIDAISIPLSIKVRASIRKERKEIQPGADRATALDLIEAIHDLPVAAVMVHGRSFEQGFSGGVDVDMIRAVKQRFPGLVLANGGIQTPEDAQRLLMATGADGVGIARGALGRPWIFHQIRTHLDGQPVTPPTLDTICRTALEHAERALKQYGPYGLIELRKHLGHYVRGVPGAAAVRAQLVRAQSLDDVRAAFQVVSK